MGDRKAGRWDGYTAAFRQWVQAKASGLRRARGHLRGRDGGWPAGPADDRSPCFHHRPARSRLVRHYRALREAFGLSRPVQEFVAGADGASLTHFFAGMRASISEKTVFVPELLGDSIQHEVPRTAFNFTGHLVVTPAPTEDALRRNIKERAYMNLVEHSLEQLVAMKLHKSELEKQRTLHKSKLRALKSGALGLEPLVEGDSTERLDAESLGRKLEAIEQELGRAAASTDTLDAYLSRITDVMSHPEDVLRVEPASVRVTRGGFKVTGQSAEPAEDIEYTKVEIDGADAFAIRLVTFPVKDLPPPEHFRPSL